MKNICTSYLTLKNIVLNSTTQCWNKL